MNARLFLFLALAVSVSVACAAPAAAPAPPAPAASPTAAGPKRGGKVTMSLWQSPTTLNFLLGTQTAIGEVLVFVVEGMTQVLPDGTRVAQLAQEVPSVQNGGVSADGKTITYKFKDGLFWSDGASVTCQDARFTWQAQITPGVGVISTAGYSEIESVDCPDPQTVVVKYKNFFAPYLTLFNSLIPKSAGDPKDMKNWAYNRKPMGTGPFKIDEWVADDHVTLSRNDKYREKDKPYLDQIIIRIVPSREVARQLLVSGEVDMMWNNSEADLPELEKVPSIKITSPLLIGGERMFLNLAENKDGSDPTKPHPILGDVKVRQAITYGINKQRIIDKLLFGKAKPGTSEINAGFFNCTDIQPYAYDAEKAKSLLTEAGWVPGPDGIRVAKGAKFAPDGTRLRLKYSTTSGDKLREDSQVLIVEDMKAVGVELFIENAPSSVVIGTWDGGSPRARGNYDIIEYSSNAGVDPHNQMNDMFASSRIPSPQNTGGRNYSRFSDSRVDDLLKQAASEPDTAKRKALYCQVAQIGNEQVNMIYLYQRSRINSYRDSVQGPVGNTAWDNTGWSAANWWVSKQSN